MKRVYLDHNATTPLDPRVREAMLPWLSGTPANPSSLHAEGRAARRAIEEARDQVAALLKRGPGEILFTSGATEANNTALRGLVAACRSSPASPRLAVSTIEHPSVLGCARGLAREGVEVVMLPVDATGRLRIEVLEAEMKKGLDVVAVMAANNEVGTLEPWEEVAQICAEHDAALHVDAVQVAGKRPLDEVPDPGRGTLCLSGHKFGGPQGCGALWIRRETRLSPLLEGGGQERGRRAGTENVAAIVGFGAACHLAVLEGTTRYERLREAEERFLEAARRHVPDLELHGPQDPHARLAGTLNMRVPDCHGEALLLGLDLEGVAISLGSACSSGAVEPSHVLEAMGLPRVENLESFRVSLSWEQPHDELARAAAALGRVVQRNRRQRRD